MTLQDFAIVTFSVDAGRLARLLPGGLTPDARRLDDGHEVAFVSAVSFRDVDFRFAIASRVWHERLRPQLGIARRAIYAVFEEAGLVERGAVPHSVLMQRAIDFDVLLPPTRV